MATGLTATIESQGSIIEEMVRDLLSGWAGLQLYIERRRAGAPADETMDTLLAELLRVGLRDGVDVRGVMTALFGKSG